MKKSMPKLPSLEIEKKKRKRTFSKQFHRPLPKPPLSKKDFSAALLSEKPENFFRFLPVHYHSLALRNKTVKALISKEKDLASKKLKKMGEESPHFHEKRLQAKVSKMGEDEAVDWQVSENRDYVLNRIIPYLTANPL